MADLKEQLYQPFFRHHMAEANASGAIPEALGARATAVRALAIKDSGVLAAEIKMTEKVEALLDKLSTNDANKKIPEAQARALSDAIIKQYKADPKFISKLEADLVADPAAAQRLESAITNNPAGVAANLSKYRGGNLAAVIPAAAAPAAAAPAPAPAKQANPTPAPTPANPTKQASAPATAKGGITTPPAAAPATPAPAAVAAAPAVDRSLDDPNPPSSADIGRASLKQILSGTDEEIRKSIDGKFVQEMAQGIKDYSDKKFPNDDLGAKGFVDKIKADGPLRERIAENLKNDPQLLRDLSKVMEDGGGDNSLVSSGVKAKLKEIYANPEVLADKDYTHKLGGELKMAQGGIGGMVGNMFKSMGIDISGIGAGLGRFFQGIMNWFGNLFSSFSSGNFTLMGNVNPNQSFFGKLGLAMDRAEEFSRNEYKYLEYARTIPRDGAAGPVSDGFQRDADGKKVMRDVTKTGPDGQTTTTKEPIYDPQKDHRVTVTGINGSSHQVFLTNNLHPQRQADGSYRWALADEVDPKTGQPSGLKDVILSKEESDRLYKRMNEAAQKSATALNVTDPKETPATLAANEEKRLVTRVDYGNGQTRPENQFDPSKAEPSPAAKRGLDPLAPGPTAPASYV